jgi:Domain of unknown function (DUF5658)
MDERWERARFGSAASGSRGRTAVALAIALVALSALDLVVTEIGVTHLGAIELNPLMAPILGTMWAPALKIGLPVFILMLASRIRTAFVLNALRALVAVYLAIAVLNVGQFVWVVS